MTLDLASLRAMRKSSSATLQKISAELQKQDSSKYSADDNRFWRATVDKAGNGSAVPSPPGVTDRLYRPHDRRFLRHSPRRLSPLSPGSLARGQGRV